MKYRNTKNGAIIDVKSKIVGGNWQAVEPANSADIEKEASIQKERRGNKKKNE